MIIVTVHGMAHGWMAGEARDRQGSSLSSFPASEKRRYLGTISYKYNTYGENDLSYLGYSKSNRSYSDDSNINFMNYFTNL